MQKAFIIFLLFTTIGHVTFGQVIPNKQMPYTITVIGKIQQPLVIIDTFGTNYHCLVMDPKNLKIIKTYKDSLELVPFGEKGRGGVIIAELIKKAQLFRLEKTLAYYKVPRQNRRLKVLVDKALIDPKLFLADLKRIERIEKVKQNINDPWLYSFNKDEEYLNIVTKKE